MKYVIYSGSQAVEISNHNDSSAAIRFAKARWGRSAYAAPYNTSMYKMICDGTLPEPPGFKRIANH